MKPGIIMTTLLLATFSPLLFLAPEKGLADEEDCTLQFSSIETELSADSKQFRFLGKPVKDSKKRELTQEATLKDGTKLVYSEGGCHHHGATFRYANVKAKDQKEAFALAEKLLKATPGKKNGFHKKELLKALAAAKSRPAKEENGFTELPCGEFNTCTLDRNEGSVRISYSFAM